MNRIGRRGLIIAFLLCFLYWGYLVFSTEMLISADAIGYEQLGQLVYQQGWGEYLRTGPHREPFYPWLVANSMRIADSLFISYHMVQKLIQVAFLFISQLLMLVLLDKLKISDPIKLITILYFGFSPAIVNAAFSLFSEIATFPFVLMMVLFCALSWQAIHYGSPGKIISMALLTAGSFLLASATKSAFSYVFLICLLPFIYLAARSFHHKVRRDFLNATLYVAVSFCIFTAGIISYMSLNKKYNGYFQVNDRNAISLLGSAYKRSNPLTPRIILAHLSSVPGNKVCEKFFTEEECRYAAWYSSESTKGEILDSLKDVPKENQSSKALLLAMNEALKHPFQYIFFTFIEGAKMPFWESTKIGFVGYPPILMNLFDSVWFKNGLRLFIALMTIFSIVFTVFKTYQDKSLLFDYSKRGESVQMRLFISLVMCAFIGIYSLCFVLTRYALPIASLYLLSIAYCVHNVKERSIRSL